MPSAQTITEVLDEAIRALTVLDLNKLEHLEQRIAEITAVDRSNNPDTITAKKHLFAMILQNCRSNLNALHRLHGRNTGDQWAH